MKTTAILEMDAMHRAEVAERRAANPHTFLTARGRTHGASNSAPALKRPYLAKKLNTAPSGSVMGKPAASGGRIISEKLPANKARSAYIRDVAVLDIVLGSTGEILSAIDSGATYLKRDQQTRSAFPAWSTVFSTIERWASLKADWDDNDAMPLDQELLKAVRKFARECEQRRISEPRPYVASDGEVSFHWDAERRAAVSFLPEGRFLAYVDQSSGSPIRISGPLDLATASSAMFEALTVLS